MEDLHTLYKEYEQLIQIQPPEVPALPLQLSTTPVPTLQDLCVRKIEKLPDLDFLPSTKQLMFEKELTKYLQTQDKIKDILETLFWNFFEPADQTTSIAINYLEELNDYVRKHWRKMLFS